MKISYEMKKGSNRVIVAIDPCGESPAVKDIIDLSVQGLLSTSVQMLSSYNLSPASKKSFVDDLCDSIKRDLVPALLQN